MRWLRLAVLLLVMTPQAAWARDCSKSFFPERPGATNGHWSQQQACAQVESGMLVTRVPDATSLSFPTLLRFGLGAGFELRALADIVAIDVPDEGSVQANAPRTGLELKFMGLRAKDQVPGVGVLVGASTVTNADAVDTLQFSTSGLFDWQLFDGFWWAVNVGIATDNQVERPDRRGILSASTVLWYDALGWMSVYINGAGSAPLPEERSWSQLVGGGLAFYPPGIDKLQFDLSADVEVTGDDHPVIVGGGVAYGF